MAKDFSPHQKKIVQRYYEHQETIRSEKLSDLVSEIWLCEDPARLTKLWGRVQVALMRAGCDAAQAAAVVGDRDTEGLAKLVQAIDAGRVVHTGPTATSQETPTQAGEEEIIALNARSLADGRTIAQMKQERAAAAGTDSLDETNLKRALKAFRRKLKTLRREDESQIRGRYVTRGQTSNIIAISPPHDFPAAVWEELARQGRLRKAGGGTYQLP